VELANLRSNWDALGRENPLWAIRSDRDSWGLDEFFATGREEIDAMLEQLAELGLEPRGRALDFGCGAGRLSQALADHFERVVGVDIARSMIDLANENNRHGEQCRFELNEAADLACFEDASFDFLYSNIVLQHVGTELAKGYMAEFLRVMAPGGIAVFQVPSHLVPFVPLPPEGYRAEITVDGATGGTLQLEAGKPVAMTFAVTNTSSVTWGDHDQVRFGLKWFTGDRDERVLIDDGQRILLPGPVAPGERIEVEANVDIPGSVGEFTVDVDLLQESVAWFEQHGSPVVRLAVTTTPGGGSAPASSDPAGEEPIVIPRMEMHAVPREDVLAIVEQHGGETIAVLQDQAAGPEWVSFRYVVQKMAPA
jgi:SAM-dependent methyltransferase